MMVLETYLVLTLYYIKNYIQFICIGMTYCLSLQEARDMLLLYLMSDECPALIESFATSGIGTRISLVCRDPRSIPFWGVRESERTTEVYTLVKKETWRKC